MWEANNEDHKSRLHRAQVWHASAGELAGILDQLAVRSGRIIRSRWPPRSRGGGASQVNQLQSDYGQLTLGEVSDLAARGDPQAIKAIKMAKQAGPQGKGGN